VISKHTKKENNALIADAKIAIIPSMEGMTDEDRREAVGKIARALSEFCEKDATRRFDVLTYPVLEAARTASEVIFFDKKLGLLYGKHLTTELLREMNPRDWASSISDLAQRLRTSHVLAVPSPEIFRNITNLPDEISERVFGQRIQAPKGWNPVPGSGILIHTTSGDALHFL